MKTKFLFVIALAFSAVAFAQKKEVKVIEKAVKSGNYSAAKAAVSAAESLLSEMDDKTKEKFYLVKAQAFLADGKSSVEDLNTAAAAFSEIKDSKNYAQDAATGIRSAITGMINSAINDQNSQQYKSAASKLETAYGLSKSDTIYLYYAASNAVNGKDYESALKYYKQLRSLKYTGIETQYFSTNVDTGEEEQAPSKQERDLLVLAKTHINPVDKASESKSAEIAKNIALIYLTLKQDDKALEAMADARAENPDDILLMRSEADIYLKMGDVAKYQEVIKKVLEKDPGNPELYYNLGVTADQAGDNDKALEYYNKAIELKPDYAAAYNNIAVMKLANERAIVDEMNNLGTSRADYARYDELKAKRMQTYREAAPFLVKALEANPKNLDAARSLYGIYQQLGEDAKADALKSTIDALEAGGK